MSGTEVCAGIVVSALLNPAERLAFDQDPVLGALAAFLRSTRRFPRAAAIAEAVGASVATIRRHLVKAGLSLRELRDRFLAHAARRLIQIGVPVKRAWSLLGFAARQSFARAFRRIIGISPRELARHRNRAVSES